MNLLTFLPTLLCSTTLLSMLEASSVAQAGTPIGIRLRINTNLFNVGEPARIWLRVENISNVSLPVDKSRLSIAIWNADSNVPATPIGLAARFNFRKIRLDPGEAWETLIDFWPTGSAKWLCFPVYAVSAYQPSDESEISFESRIISESEGIARKSLLSARGRRDQLSAMEVLSAIKAIEPDTIAALLRVYREARAKDIRAWAVVRLAEMKQRLENGKDALSINEREILLWAEGRLR